MGLEPTLRKDPDLKSLLLRSWAFLVVQRYPVSGDSSLDQFTCVRGCSPALSSKCRQDVARHEGVYVICARRPLMMCCGTAFLSAQLSKIFFQSTPKLRSCPCHNHIAADGSNTMNEGALLKAPHDMPYSRDWRPKGTGHLVCVLLLLRRVEEPEADVPTSRSKAAIPSL